MKNKVLFLIVLVLSACSPQKRLERLVKRHPELLVTDTINIKDTVVFKQIKADTVFSQLKQTDTVTLVKDRLTVRYVRKRDTVYLSGECRSDTIILEKRIPVKHTIIKEKIPWLALVGVACLLYLLLFLIKRPE